MCACVGGRDVCMCRWEGCAGAVGSVEYTCICYVHYALQV